MWTSQGLNLGPPDYESRIIPNSVKGFDCPFVVAMLITNLFTFKMIGRDNLLSEVLCSLFVPAPFIFINSKHF